MCDRPIASDLSYEVAKFRREHPELAASDRDSTNQILRPVPCIFDGFIADRPGGISEAEWNLERQRRRLQG